MMSSLHQSTEKVPHPVLSLTLQVQVLFFYLFGHTIQTSAQASLISDKWNVDLWEIESNRLQPDEAEEEILNEDMNLSRKRVSSQQEAQRFKHMDL